MRTVLLKQRKALAVLVRVENSHPGGERNFAHALAENFPVELHGAPHAVVLDVQLHLGMLDGVGKRREVRPLWRLRGECHEPVVFVERQRDIAGVGQGQSGFFFGNAHKAKQQHHQNVFHRTPAFFSC